MMPTFGFSAFLKLLSQNDRPQRTQVRGRLIPSEGGYDFHRSLKILARRYLVDGEDIALLNASAEQIVRPAERSSALLGLAVLAQWRAANPGEIIDFPPVTYTSPTGVFKVHFTPDFGLRTPSGVVAVHIWNTARPTLIPRMAYMALGLIPGLYSAHPHAPDDLGVLSLRNMHLYLLSDSQATAAAAIGMASLIEDVFASVREELELPPHMPPGEQPFG